MLSYCLPTLREMQYPRYLTVVVDNGSNDQSIEFIRENFPEVIIIATNKNLGWASGNNIGIEYAKTLKADFVVLLNNDTKVNFGFLRAIANFSSKHPKASVFAGKYYFMGTRILQVAGGGFFSEKEMCGENFIGSNEKDIGQYDIPRKVDYVYEAAFVARLQLFSVIGLFDPLWLFNYEGPDLCKRASRVGLESWYVPQAFVEHEVNATFDGCKTVPREMVSRTLAKSKNRFRFLLKHYPFNLALKIQEEYVLKSIAYFYSQPNHAFRELYSTFWNFLHLANTRSLYGLKRENYEEVYAKFLSKCKIT